MATVQLTHANGTAPLPPLSLPVVPSGPVSPWPRQPDDSSAAPRTVPVADAAAAAPPRFRDLLSGAVSRLHAPDGDTAITWSMAATVAVVAVDAAIVSYSHIYALATGQQGSGTETGIQPRLLPLSIDGVIAEASLVLLYAARHKLRAPRLATFMLWLGIAATVAANVTHGLPSSMLPPVAHVVIAATLSAWPAGAFIGSVEMAMQLVRAARDVAAGDTIDDSTSDITSDTVQATEDDSTPNSGSDNSGDIEDGESGDTKPKPRRTTVNPVDTAIRRHPDWDDDKIADKCGVSKRTVQRRRSALAKAAAGN